MATQTQTLDQEVKAASKNKKAVNPMAFIFQMLFKNAAHLISIAVITTSSIVLYSVIHDAAIVLVLHVSMTFAYVEIYRGWETTSTNDSMQERLVEMENTIAERLDRIERNV